MVHLTKNVNLHLVGPTDVDEKVANLVEALCDLEWTTMQSCQNNNGRVWISFAATNFATEFLELVAKKSIHLQPFVLAATTQGYDKQPKRLKFKNRWWVDSYTDVIYYQERWSSHICIRISIRFPREHLDEVTKIVLRERAQRRLCQLL